MKDFLNTLAVKDVIGTSKVMEENIECLKAWGVTIYEDRLEDAFDYADLSIVISQLMAEGDDFNSLKAKGVIEEKAEEKQTVKESEAEAIIDRTVNYLNNRQFEPGFAYKYRNELKENPQKNENEQ